MDHRLFPARIANHLDTTIDHVHYLGERHPVDWLSGQQPQPHYSETSNGRHWYLNDWYSTAKIANNAGVSHVKVVKELQRLGVTIHPRSAGR